MNSPAEIIRAYLVKEGLGAVDSTWPIYVGKEPESPDNVLTAYDLSGRNHGRATVTGERFEHHGVQLRVRSASYQVGYIKAGVIAVSFDVDSTNVEVKIGEVWYLIHSVVRSSDVLHLGMEDTSRRSVFVVNVLMAISKL